VKEQAMILGVIQGRMTSTRLPGKVLADIEGMPMIGRQIERLRRSRHLDALVLATSHETSDNPLVDYVTSLGVAVVRGPLQDVLARFAVALDAFPQAEVLVRLTADCPLTDWRVLDALLERRAATDVDYANNTNPVRTFPHGLDVEVMKVSALRAAALQATEPYDREHVTPFLYRNPDLFKLETLRREPSLAHLRWTVDYPDDLVFVRHVYRALLVDNPDFGTEDIAALDWNSSRAEV
jgi:spore coat polysaccharide biosynthesis protein SpsF